MTKTNRALRQAVRLALATAASASAPLAFAQTAPAESASPVQEVVVTGSRLMQANGIVDQSITSVSQEDIKQTGLVRTEDVLQNLPQVAVEQTSGNSISSVGVATVSLRGLGSQRTLALVNNRRLNPGGAGGVPGGNASSADINQIPADLIERVDVLTGGASAVYGADAVAGVVNFVMNTHYQGVEINAGYSFNNHKNNNDIYLGTSRTQVTRSRRAQ
jgi:outer membrane cobalamin receptor